MVHRKGQMNIFTEDDKYLGRLKEIVLSQVDTDTVMVFIFGSRTSPVHRRHSDVDIGLLSDDPLPTILYHKIRNAIDASSIPFEVDIVDFTRVSPEFRKKAQEKMIIWNSPKCMKKKSTP